MDNTPLADVLPFQLQESIPGVPKPKKRKEKDEARRNTKSEPIPVSPDMAAAKARFLPRCYVCGARLQEGNYCDRHPKGKWRWISCSEPGCTKVTERRMYGHNRFTCWEHKPLSGVPDKPTPPPATPIGRAQIREMIDRRKALAAAEKEEKARRLREFKKAGYGAHRRPVPNPKIGIY